MFLGKEIFMLSKQKSGSIRGNISISDFMGVQVYALSKGQNVRFLLYKFGIERFANYEELC